VIKIIIIDVDLNTLMRINSGNPTRYFYTELHGEETTIYTEMNGMLFRFIYLWSNDQNDTLFYERYLSSAFRIEKIGVFGEGEWQKAFMGLYNKLDEIKEIIEAIENDNVG